MLMTIQQRGHPGLFLLSQLTGFTGMGVEPSDPETRVIAKSPAELF
jgi:hypothetical protein